MSDKTGYTVAAIIIGISGLVVLYFAGITFYQLYKNDAIRTFASNLILYLTILDLIFYFLACVGAFLDPVYQIQDNKLGIDVSTTISITFYALGKWLTYVLFTSRLKYVFQDIKFHYSNNVINFIYVILGIQFIILSLWVTGSTHNQFNPPAVSWDNSLNVTCGTLFYLIDFLLAIMLPILFTRKLYQLVPSSLNFAPSSSPKSNDNNNDNNQSNNDEPVSNDQIPSVGAVGVTSSNMPISNKQDNDDYVDSNEHKYNQILNTVARITLLATLVCSSSIACVVLDALIESNNPSSGLSSVGKSVFKIDCAVNAAGIALCYVLNDKVYYFLCNPCHQYYKNKNCCGCCWRKRT